MKTISKCLTIMATAFGLALAATHVLAQSIESSGTGPAAEETERARAYFTNLELIDQNGDTVRFFDDVLKDKVVVINFIFTNCDGACPLMTHKLTQVRDLMEGRIDAPIRFVSLSIDPERDTPAAMRAFARTHDADHPGWMFLTGDPENLEHIIRKLGQYTDSLETHSTMMLAGNVGAAHWIKIPPQDQAPQIAEKLEYLMEPDGV